MTAEEQHAQNNAASLRNARNRHIIALVVLGAAAIGLEIIFGRVVSKVIEVTNANAPQNPANCLVLGAALIASAALIGFAIHAVVTVAKNT